MAIQTICDIFYRSVDTYRKPEHLKHKKDGAWRAISSEELRRAVEEISMGLRSLGIGKGDKVAILSENRPEWAFADLAVLCAGAADATIYATLTPAQVLYILADSESRAVFVSTTAQAAKVAEVRAQLPHLQHVVRFDATPAAGTTSLDELRAKGKEALAADRDAVRRRAAEVTGGRPRHPHLHLGHHRRPQGGHAHPRQPRPQRPRRGEGLPDGGPRVDGPQLPAAVPQLRAHRRPQLHAPPRGHHRLRGERREGAGEHAGGAAVDHVLGAPPLREDVRAGEREGGVGPAAAAEGLPLGDRGGAEDVRPHRGAHRARGAPEAEALPRGQARLLEDQGADGRPAPALHLRRGAARPRDRRVLRRRRDARLRGLRSLRDEPRHHLQPPRPRQAGDGGPAPRARRGEDRAGRRDPRPAAPTS